MLCMKMIKRAVVDARKRAADKKKQINLNSKDGK